jgi:hypothetical protein
MGTACSTNGEKRIMGYDTVQLRRRNLGYVTLANLCHATVQFRR